MRPGRSAAPPRPPHPLLLALTLVLVAGACAPAPDVRSLCRPLRGVTPLPAVLQESSGVAPSLRHRGVLWTHNDAGSILFAVDRDGRETARFPLPLRLADWEDVAVAACPRGGSCLWAADTGDNYEERTHLRLVRFPEPDPEADTVLEEPDVFPVRLPDGPRDIEALLVLPGERILLVTKGRNHPVTVYRYPPPLSPDTVVLEEVQRLSEGPRIFPRQVTGGAVEPTGSRLVLRSYQALRFYRLEDDTLTPLPDGEVSLRELGEPQGEGVGMALDGEVVLSSEGGPGGGPGSLAALRCSGP